MTKQKFILQLMMVLAAVFLLFCCFITVDRFHKRYVDYKVIEMNYNYQKAEVK